MPNTKPLGSFLCEGPASHNSRFGGLGWGKFDQIEFLPRECRGSRAYSKHARYNLSELFNRRSAEVWETR